MKCEKCEKEHDGKYGSGRFCSEKCARSFSTTGNRKEINKKVSNALRVHHRVGDGNIKLCDYGCGQEARYTLGNGKWCCEPHYSKCQKMKSKNSEGTKKAHSEGRSYKIKKEDALRGTKSFRKKLTREYEKLPFVDKPIAEKYRVVLKDQNGKCFICKIDTWCGKPLNLHIDHIDGDTRNNNRDNLQYLCPNCHSQTPTYCRSGNRKDKLNGQKVEDQALIKTIQETTSVHQTLIKCGLAPKGRNYHRVYKLIGEHNLRFLN